MISLFYSRICIYVPLSKLIQQRRIILVRLNDKCLLFCGVLIKIICIVIKVGYKPNATMNTAHHMLLYGCGEPGNTKLTW